MKEKYLPDLFVCFMMILATSIGIVTAIAAPASIKVDFEGTGGHAGAVLMPKRYIDLTQSGLGFPFWYLACFS